MDTKTKHKHKIESDCKCGHCHSESELNSEHTHDENNGCGCAHDDHDHDHAEGGILSNPILKYGLVAVSLASLIVSHMELLKGILPVDIAWIALIHGGIPIFKSGIAALVKKRKITSSLLMMTAIIACVAIGEVFAAGEIAFIMYIGELLEEFTVEKANSGIKRLLKLSPTKANIKRNGAIVEIDAREVERADLICVKPGEVIPCDGNITFGETTVDQSSITGESMPLERSAGSEVFAGTINVRSYIEVTAGRNGQDSTINRLIKLTQQAKQKKAPIERISDRMAGFIVPAAIIIALGVLVFTRDIMRAVTILVVFCPCALALATPTAIVAAIGRSARSGVLIKSGEALEKISKCDTILFDKTGTITTGKPKVSDVFTSSNAIHRERLLAIAASAESMSEHPLAKALVEYTSLQGINPEAAPSSFDSIAGYGIAANIAGSDVHIGNLKLMERFSIVIPAPAAAKAEEFTSQGKSIFVVAVDKKLAGIVALSDTMRSGVKETVQMLKKLSYNEIAIMSGDNGRAVGYIAAQAGITSKNYSNCLPEDKLATLENFRKNGHRAVVVGDGVNDAPVLASADCGIAMAHLGSDIAIEAADVALMRDKIESVAMVAKLAKKTYRRIIINIVLSMSINIIAVVLATMGSIDPVIGALFHNGGSIAVVLSSMGLLLMRDVQLK